MSHSSKTEQRRLRPYLGTFVDVRVSGLAERKANEAINRSFAQIATVEERMSAHDPNSDLGRLYQRGATEPVAVHPWTFAVMEAAALLNRLSSGVFDVTVGDTLERRHYLPRWTYPAHECRNTPSKIEFLSDCRIRLSRPTRIDLGGIAKGFAVDRAIDALLEAGAVSGCVNAGGDFRIFSRQPEPLMVRHPRSPQQLINLGQIQSGAVATSAAYFSKWRYRRRTISPLIDGRTKKSIAYDESVSVLAPSCMWADALTKIIAIDRRRGAALLKRFDARALILSSSENGIRLEQLLPHWVLRKRDSMLGSNDGRTDLSSRR